MSCSDSDEYEKITPPVVVDLSQVPYQKLSDYNFFKDDIKNLIPNDRVLPYQPASELFTDYALKSRFVWLPINAKANLTHQHQAIDLPIGAVLIKNFFYENLHPNNHRRVIETRLLINTTDGWQPFTYIWNSSQTEAFLNDDGQMVHLEWRKTPTETIHIDYHIPSKQMCIDCHHKTYIGDELTPIGIKPYHLNNNYNYAEGSKNQIQKWQEVGYLNPHTVALDDPTVNYKNPSENLSKRVRSFLDINCAHCHRVDGAAELLAIKFPFHQTVNNNGLGICDDRILPAPNPGFFGNHYVLPQQPELSLIYHKITINTPDIMMPPIGRTIVNQEAEQLMRQWILSLDECP
jgi:uncharacterized repeat protein (TIGR03806 family)